MEADAWDDFAATTLWPQEWALGQWQTWRLDRGRLSLTPLAPPGPAPRPTPFDEGGDPRVWRIGYNPPPSIPDGPVIAQEVNFQATELQGLPPALHALRVVVGAEVSRTLGQVRVALVRYRAGRFQVRVLLR